MGLGIFVLNGCRKGCICAINKYWYNKTVVFYKFYCLNLLAFNKCLLF